MPFYKLAERQRVADTQETVTRQDLKRLGLGGLLGALFLVDALEVLLA